MTPSDIFNWQGPTEYLVPSSEQWYALTGRVIELRAEEDGDLHIALKDATGDKPGIAWLSYRQNRNGASFANLYLVGRELSLPFASGLGEN